jgi:hypothetical protein
VHEKHPELIAGELPHLTVVQHGCCEPIGIRIVGEHQRGAGLLRESQS